ncbi:HEPN domain-containing protein [Entomomonas asaccharolytica]|uniref:HEPN domain-containing protein n=1 Tax=Entomomonas asaccharolytica TaxID=2785331 RepID=A0A974NGS9_9GAMM|nr:hypothetical protein [Entomomonas asaccharolytica]QQP86383.1 hypothetical protein JHT90_03835 [Entomomonas asaccharolytica]
MKKYEIKAETVWNLDKKYAKEDIPFYRRPYCAVQDILGVRAITPETDEAKLIKEAYKKLIPEVSTNWSGYGVGIIASMDQVRKFILPIVFGQVNISIYKGIGFTDEHTWWIWCRFNKETAENSKQSFINIYDFAYGVNALSDKQNEAHTFWEQATSNLEVIADSLVNTYRTNSILQPICMAAELAMKGTLSYLGLSKDELKHKYGHSHKKLAKAMIKKKPHSDDKKLLAIINRLPDYIETRYDDSNMSRLEIVNLALDIQFIVASALRRISGIEIEKGMVSK